MIEYCRQRPIIFSHVPKTAGTSVQTVFKSWFGEGLMLHYANAETGDVPGVLELNHPTSPGSPVCLYGHFNRLRGFGIPGRYDWVSQFVTMLRDPLEQTISRYFFLRERSTIQGRIPSSLDEFVSKMPSTLLLHFPALLTKDNYRDVIEEKFVAVGITEQMEDSIAIFSSRLGFPALSVPRVNVTARDQFVSNESRDRFIERHQLEYTVYNYCKKRLGSQIRATCGPVPRIDAF